ncbi:Uncharacterised protein [Chryseobacterium nakagawai]|nr:Uncharacterised protein [Chryseobacterium nakagawai]
MKKINNKIHIKEKNKISTLRFLAKKSKKKTTFS